MRPSPSLPNSRPWLLILALLALLAPAAPAAPATASAKAKAKAAAASAAAAAKSVESATAPAKEQPSPGQLLDRIVAVVNDGVVLQSELDARMREISTSLRTQNVALPADNVLRSQVLDQLILEEIQAHLADRAGIKVSDEQVNGALEDVAKRQKITLEQLPARLAEDDIDYAQYREELRHEIAREILRQRDVIQHIVVTPRELDQYMQRQQQTASAQNEYNVSHILIAIAQDATPEQLARARKLAHDIADRARQGEDFGKLAVTYSQAATALQGGLIGWRKGNELPTFLADVIARMKPSEVSEVIQTSSGFHLVRLNDKRAAGGPQIVQQFHLRHILMKPNEIEDDATVQQKLEHIRADVLAGKEDFAVLAHTNSQDPGSAINGGDLGWSELSSFAPDFARVASGLQDGEISQPFHTEFGWHIVQVLGRRTYNNSTEAAREHAYEALRDSRVDEATELWRQQIRDEAYVDLRL